MPGGGRAPGARLVFATRNQGKLRELRQLLALDGVEVVCLDDLPAAPEIEETGATFADNARLKAEGVMQATGLPSLADDSGLEVDALDGAPGVHSARYAGPGATDDQRLDLLLEHLREVPAGRRSARFRCAVAFADPARPGAVELCEGSCEGRILFDRRGSGGFGYDPVFFVEQLGQTFAEAAPEQKNRISHRGRAMVRMAAYLRRHLGQQAAE